MSDSLHKFERFGWGLRVASVAEKSDADVLRILTTNGDPPADMVADADEDEGQPAASEIFTEEDVEAINDSAVAETGGVEGAGAGDDGVDLREVGDDAPAYPGIAILPDELGARRNAVLAAITTEKLTRLSIAMDPSRADFLAARFAEYQNAGALGLAIDDALAADSRAFQELRDRRDRITNFAMQLEQSALDGDMDRLSAMHAGLGDGWP